MKTKPHLLLHPLFLFSLFVLLLNDFYLKYEYHNDFTGKLSDFTGLFTFFIFLRAFFPSYRKTIFILVSLFFLWWKSPLSSPFISFINTLHIPVQRVVDYSDYMALVILPLAYFIQPVQYSPSISRKIAIGCIGLVSFFAFTATTIARRLTDENKVLLHKEIKTRRTETGILDAFDKNGLKYRVDTAYDKHWVYPKPYRKTKDATGKVIYEPLPQDSIYTKTEGSIYTISELIVGEDTIYDLQIAIQDRYQRRNFIVLRNFSHRSLNDSSRNHNGYYLYRKLKKPIKRRFKEIVK